jgi:transcriptional regulator with GAF, ATPase, and Fis domain
MATDAREWRRLMEAGATVTAYMDLDEVLRRVLAYATESAKAEWSSVILHDGDAHELVVVAGGGAGGQARGRRFPDSAGIAGAVLRSGHPRLVSDAQEDVQLFPDVERDCGHALRSLMAAPLKVGGRILGVVEAINKAGGGGFHSGDLERFVGCCSLIAVALENASLYRRLGKDGELLKRSQEDQTRPLIAESCTMRRALLQAERAAPGRSTVLIIGETGTGKEQVARHIHEISPRAHAHFVALNCGALPEGLIESELFGHEKGAFTGADRRRIGRFELADGGTLFLDEIGELPPVAQVKLLRVLQEHEITRLGGVEPLHVDVRLIAATHRDLPTEVRAGRFRDDLFFRVHVVPVSLPPLRERREDVEPLVRFFLQRLACDLGRGPRAISPEALERLRGHHWPGNVRELENLIERLLVLGDEGPITVDELAELVPGSTPAAVSVSSTAEGRSLWDQERQLLEEALTRAGHNQTRAARLLKISREQLRTRMKRYGFLALKPPAEDGRR